MAGKCVICNNELSAQTRNKIQCVDCNLYCHWKCEKLTKEDVDFMTSQNEIYRCPPCKQQRRKSMQVVSEAEEGKGSFAQIIQMLEEARDDRKRLEREMNTSFEFQHKLVDDQKALIDSQNKKIDNFLETIEELKQQNLNLTKKVKELERKVDENEQYARSNNIEIHGVPVAAEEDVYEVVSNVANTLGVRITREAIDVCHRMGKRQDSQAPPGILARLVRREDKINILMKRREKRNFNTNDLGFTQPAAPIYINENLCPARREIFRAARQIKKEKEYTYLWIRNGRILMRKEPSSSMIVLSSMDDLQKL